MGIFDFFLPKRKGDPEKLFRKATEARKVAHFREAIRYYDMLLKIDSKHVDSYIGKGGCLIGRGRFQDSLECFNKAIELDPGNPNAWRSKGIALMNLGSNEEGRKCKKKAREIIESGSWKKYDDDEQYLDIK